MENQPEIKKQKFTIFHLSIAWAVVSALLIFVGYYDYRFLTKWTILFAFVGFILSIITAIKRKKRTIFTIILFLIFYFVLINIALVRMNS